MSDEFDAWEVTQNPAFGMAHCPVAKVSSSQPCHHTFFACPIFHISGGPLVRKHKCCLEYSLGEKLSESIQKLSYSYRFITAILIDPSHCSCRSWTHRFHSHPLLHDESRPQTGKFIKQSIFGFAVNTSSSYFEITIKLRIFRLMLIKLIENIKLSGTSRNTQN